jgi:hypothetical protein
MHFLIGFYLQTNVGASRGGRRDHKPIYRLLNALRETTQGRTESVTIQQTDPTTRSTSHLTTPSPGSVGVLPTGRTTTESPSTGKLRLGSVAPIHAVIRDKMTEIEPTVIPTPENRVFLAIFSRQV